MDSAILSNKPGITVEQRCRIESLLPARVRTFASRLAAWRRPSERRLVAVPGVVVVVLVVALAGQFAWHASRPAPRARAEDLPAPPALAVVRVAALGDTTAFAQLLMLWLQAFDNQPGISIPFARLDYARVEAWLDRILDLDPHGRYPLLAASRIYGSVNAEGRQRRMLEFVYRRFLEAPGERWPWLAHAALIAKYRLRDLPLALRYARALTEHANGPGVPFWVRDLSVLVLQDMGEFDSARVLIGGLIDSGQITDPTELNFLQSKLEEVARGTAAAPPPGVDFSTHR